MNIKELNGQAIKKALNAKSASYRWHNRNTRGGNFGINIRGVSGNDWEISGDYNTQGEIAHLRFGRLFAVGIRMFETEFELLMKNIGEIAEKIQTLEIEAKCKAVA